MVSPIPSCPYVLSPQPHRLPLLHNNIEKNVPTHTCVCTLDTATADGVVVTLGVTVVDAVLVVVVEAVPVVVDVPVTLTLDVVVDVDVAVVVDVAV